MYQFYSKALIFLLIKATEIQEVWINPDKGISSVAAPCPFPFHFFSRLTFCSQGCCGRWAPDLAVYTHKQWASLKTYKFQVVYKYCQLSAPALDPARFTEGGIVCSQTHLNTEVHFIYMTLEPCPDKLTWALPRWCPFAQASFITIPWGEGRQPAGTGSQTYAGEIACLHHCMANTAMTVLKLPMFASFCCLTCCVQVCFVIYIY